MKTLKHFLRLNPATLLFVCLVLITTTGCKKLCITDSSTNSSSASSTNILTPLIAYKASKHHIFVGYIVDDSNDPADSHNPVNAPDSADYLVFFAGYDTTATNLRATQAKGTKLVVCHWLKDAYFDGSAKDPATKVTGYVNPKGFDQNNANAKSTYDHWASDIYNKDIVAQGLDGIDLDVERSTFGGDVPFTAANGGNLVLSIAKYYGPNCTKCATGQKPVFFYDTDNTSFDKDMYTPNKTNYNYVLFQSYTTGNRAWGGSGTASFSPLVNFYGLDKLIFLVNGDSFTYPNGTEDVKGEDAIATTDLYNYATWVKNNSGIGVGCYRMNRDYNHKPTYAVSRHAIQLMNPAN
jgi:hypothetical protein